MVTVRATEVLRAIILVSAAMSGLLVNATTIVIPPSFQAAAVWGQKVYITSEGDEFLTIVDLATGAALGRVRLKDSFYVWSSAPVFDSDRGFVQTAGFLYCFDAKTHRVVWGKRVAWGTGPAGVVNGLVITSTVEAGEGASDPPTIFTVSAFDAKTGKRKWSRSGLWYLACLGPSVVAVNNIGPIRQRALDPKTGNDLWAKELAPDVIAREWALTQVPDSPYAIAVHEGIVICLDLGSGRILWRVDIDMDNDGRIAAVTDGTRVYLVELRREAESVRVSAVDVASGDLEPLHAIRAFREVEYRVGPSGWVLDSSEEDDRVEYPSSVCGIDSGVLVVAGWNVAWGLDLETGAVLWCEEFGGTNVGLGWLDAWGRGVLVTKGRVVLLGSSGGRKAAVCLDVRTGQRVWTYPE